MYIDPSEKTYFCMKNGITIYPVIVKGEWLKLVVDIQGKKIFGKEIYNPNIPKHQKKIQQTTLDLYDNLYKKLNTKPK